jgi:hypothetical protein
VLSVQLRWGAESSQTARVLSGAGWWTDTGTDICPASPPATESPGQGEDSSPACWKVGGKWTPEVEVEAMAEDAVQREVLPIPDQAYPGVVTYDARSPDTRFPPIRRLLPPAGAPNVLVVLIDDVGFGASSAFGGPVNLPTAELAGWVGAGPDDHAVGDHVVPSPLARFHSIHKNPGSTGGRTGCS